MTYGRCGGAAQRHERRGVRASSGTNYTLPTSFQEGKETDQQQAPAPLIPKDVGPGRARGFGMLICRPTRFAGPPLSSAPEPPRTFFGRLSSPRYARACRLQRHKSKAEQPAAAVHGHIRAESTAPGHSRRPDAVRAAAPPPPPPPLPGCIIQAAGPPSRSGLACRVIRGPSPLRQSHYPTPSAGPLLSRALPPSFQSASRWRLGQASESLEGRPGPYQPSRVCASVLSG